MPTEQELAKWNSMPTVRVQLPLQPPISDMKTGENVRIWGHKFVMQDDGILTCDMHPHVAKIELNAKRVIKYQGKADPMERFSDDLTDFYGAGNADNLATILLDMTVDDINVFCDQKLGVTWPKNMKKDTIVSKTVKAVNEKLGMSTGSEDDD